MSTLAQDQRTLAFKKRAAAKAMKVAKAIAADAKAYEMHVYERMEAEELLDENGGGSVRNKFGTFVASATLYAHITDPAAFEAWAKEQDETYFDEKPREQILNQLVREIVDNGQDFPPGLSFYPRKKVTVKGGERA